MGRIPTTSTSATSNIREDEISMLDKRISMVQLRTEKLNLEYNLKIAENQNLKLKNEKLKIELRMLKREKIGSEMVNQKREMKNLVRIHEKVTSAFQMLGMVIKDKNDQLKEQAEKMKELEEEIKILKKKYAAFDGNLKDIKEQENRECKSSGIE